MDLLHLGIMVLIASGHYLFQNEFEVTFLRLRLNRLQSDSGNDFSENACVWLSQKTLFSGK